MTSTPVILASTSVSRRIMLEAAGVTFTVAAPELDEEALKDALLVAGADGYGLANALAERKALEVSLRHPEALTLGADQVLICEGRPFNKVTDEHAARATLRELSGREHELISAAIIAKGGNPIWRHVEIARLQMRDFSDAFLDEYLAAEFPDILGSVGCYRIEGRGAQLFSRVSGDHFCIRGLPLFAVLEALRRNGALLA